MTSNISRTLREEYERNKREGLKEGLEEGLKEGLEQGIKEGIKEGLEQGILLTKKVLKLSMEGVAIDEIAKLCEITEEKVNEILE